MSDALGSLRSCVLILKTSVGSFGMLAAALILIPPIITTALWRLALEMCSAAKWLVEDAFGLRCGGVACSEIVFRPSAAANVNGVEGSFCTPRGVVAVCYKKEGDVAALKLEVPVDATLTCELFGDAITENGKPLAAEKTTDGRVKVTLPSGSYHLLAR